MSTYSNSETASADLGFGPLRVFSVEEYRRMGESGVLTEDDRVELLEGWIVHKMNHNPRQDACIDLLHETLRAMVPDGWRIRVQSAITTSDSEPEPDLAIVRGSARDFSNRHPGPSDIGLVVEVSDTSLSKDRRKKRIYARAGIPQYWIVNLVEGQLEVCAAVNRDAAVYEDQNVCLRPDTVTFQLDDRDLGSVEIEELLP